MSRVNTISEVRLRTVTDIIFSVEHCYVYFQHIPSLVSDSFDLEILCS